MNNKQRLLDAVKQHHNEVGLTVAEYKTLPWSDETTKKVEACCAKANIDVNGNPLPGHPDHKAPALPPGKDKDPANGDVGGKEDDKDAEIQRLRDAIQRLNAAAAQPPGDTSGIAGGQTTVGAAAGQQPGGGQANPPANGGGGGGAAPQPRWWKRKAYWVGFALGVLVLVIGIAIGSSDDPGGSSKKKDRPDPSFTVDDFKKKS